MSTALRVVVATLTALATCVCSQQVIHLKLNDSIQLTPAKPSRFISSVVWKYDKNLLAEWVYQSIPVTYYSKFKTRARLDVTTGSLALNNLRVADSGMYSVEVNNQVLALTYMLVVMASVPNPEVQISPPLCNATLDSCTLSCEGSAPDTGPVEYFWRKDNGAWTRGERDLEIANDDDTGAVELFACRMTNPVSVGDSDVAKNPFYRGNNMPLYVSLGVILGVGALLVPLCAAVCRCPKKTQVA